jgi:hypothetical protein
VTGPRATLPLPYGPNTPAVRRFLQRLAGKPTSDCAAAARAYLALQADPDFRIADRLLGAAIERSGRTDARDAVVGPIVQLMSGHAERLDADGPTQEDLAETALAAALGLIVRDEISDKAFNVLYSAFAGLIPVAELDG